MQPWVYIVLVGAAAILYALTLPARAKKGKAQIQNLKETEAALELYMADIERENEELVQLVGSIKQQTQSNQNGMQGQINELKKQLAEQQTVSVQLTSRITAEEKGLGELAAAFERITANTATSSADAKPAEAMKEEPPAAPAKPVSSIKLRYPRLFELHEQGKSIDSIAKTAGLQRGEVQLILQLAKQEETG